MTRNHHQLFDFTLFLINSKCSVRRLLWYTKWKKRILFYIYLHTITTTLFKHLLIIKIPPKKTNKAKILFWRRKKDLIIKVSLTTDYVTPATGPENYYTRPPPAQKCNWFFTLNSLCQNDVNDYYTYST